MRTELIAIATAVGFMALTTSAAAAGTLSDATAANQLTQPVSTLVSSSGGAVRARAASAPTVSPYVRRSFVSRNSYQYCSYGYLCAFVPYRSGSYRFDFTSCKRYRLANWYGSGWLINAQYGGVRFRISDANSRTIFSGTARRVFRGIDWTPAYFVRPC